MPTTDDTNFEWSHLTHQLNLAALLLGLAAIALTRFVNVLFGFLVFFLQQKSLFVEN
jgi:hypothetical protein